MLIESGEWVGEEGPTRIRLEGYGFEVLCAKRIIEKICDRNQVFQPRHIWAQPLVGKLNSEGSNDKVVVLMSVSDSYSENHTPVSIGVAQCNTNDEFDFDTGLAIATRRAFLNSGWIERQKGEKVEDEEDQRAQLLNLESKVSELTSKLREKELEILDLNVRLREEGRKNVSLQWVRNQIEDIQELYARIRNQEALIEDLEGQNKELKDRNQILTKAFNSTLMGLW